MILVDGGFSGTGVRNVALNNEVDMLSIDHQIKQLKRMLERKKVSHHNSYTEVEIISLETSIEALELIQELEWEHIVLIRKGKRDVGTTL